MNPRIEEAREMGLSVLQPSRRDLERGLELHADALVCEAYGFAPRGAMDENALFDAIESGAPAEEYDEFRENMTQLGPGLDPAQRDEVEAAWEASGVTCICQNAGHTSHSPNRVLRRLARFTHLTDLLSDFVFRAATPEDIAAAKGQGRRCLYMTTCGVPLEQRWVSVEDELQHIRIFFQLGVRMMHLTYNRRNMLGDGCGEAADAGLSDFGRAAVAEMNRVGVIVDVAHSGWRTSLEAAQASKVPVIASHSGCVEVNNHFRNKPDEVIRAIADTGGFVGVACVPRFLGGTGDLIAFLDHLDHLIRRFGADRAAIGTDVAYAIPTRPAEGRQAPPRPPHRALWRSLWPNTDFRDPRWNTPPQTLSLAWTNWPLFTVGLVQRGHSDEDIRKVIGGNVLRVAREVWGSREVLFGQAEAGAGAQSGKS